MRLTESVENLRMRARIELKAGKEESARQLIAEKQKIMQALERSKKRAEVLEELSNTLGEVCQTVFLLCHMNTSVLNEFLSQSLPTICISLNEMRGI